ncbi:MAG TPA: MBL fold metallo-hydrolase [Albitalea sp.]|uniref:MBL fold metallo-hydrolase n=1 Tax=Piscinibacter sp. TaxID=1903157 RepID=UPI002ED5703E
MRSFDRPVRVTTHDLPRRRLVLASMSAVLSVPWVGSKADSRGTADAVEGGDRVGEPLTPWRPGTLDIHHIATGCGNSILAVMSDGTSVLIDAGAASANPGVTASPRPDGSHRPGQWIARYARRHLAPTGRARLDYALITHLHPDHLGDVSDAQPTSTRGEYRLTGIMDVADSLPIGTLVDRCYPDYDFPLARNSGFGRNYVAFVQSRLRAGEPVQRFAVGRDDQFRCIEVPASGSTSIVRNIAANGEVWTGRGEKAIRLFPSPDTLPEKDQPTENMLSAAIRIDHGRFRYFTGGDLTSYTFDGEQPWRDILGAAARAAGPVDVATADHHGMFDGLSAGVVRTLRPSAWVIQTWHLAHPDMLQLERMLSERLYSGRRDVFATNVMEANVLANGRLMRQLRSTEGHVIVRVEPGGRAFRVVVTRNADERDTVAYVTDRRSVAERQP